MTARSSCAVAGCPGFAVYRGRCERHAPRPWEGSYERRRAEGAIPPSALRRAVRARARGSCERCRRMLPLGSGAIDHRVPHAAGGATDLANLWLLCDECHDAKTRADLAELRRARA